MSLDEPFVPTAEFNDPADLRLIRLPGGEVRLYRRDDHFDSIKLRLAFPLTHTERMVSFLSDEDAHLASISDYHALDPGSRLVVEEEIRQQYFQPTILRILAMRKRYGLIEMEIETDAGRKLVRFRSPRDDIREVQPGHFLLTDAASNRYELPCLEALDKASQALWHNLV